MKDKIDRLYDMTILKEDGSLDIEKIDSLPLEEHMKIVGTFTHEQFKEYVSAIPLTESKVSPRAVRVNYSLEDELARGSVLAEEFMEKCERNILSDENVLAKKRWTSSEMFLWKNVMKKNLLAEDYDPGYKCITRFGVIAADCLETNLLSPDLDHIRRSSMAKSLGSGHYVWMGEQACLGGKTAYSMFVINISVRAVAYYSRKFQQPAFIYGEFRDGHIHSEYWEKADVTKPLSARVNQYQKKEEMDAMITSAGFDDQSVIGVRFEYAVPFSLFPAISEYIHKNISTLDAHSRTGAMNIALYGIGENAWRYRGLAYRGIKPMELKQIM